MVKVKKEKVEKKVIKIFAKYTDKKNKNIQKESKLKEELGLTSYDLLSITADFEKAFSITFQDITCLEDLYTVEDVTNFIYQRLLTE